MKKTAIIVGLVLLFFPRYSSFAQTFPLWDSLDVGSYKVGFKLIETFDYSRIYNHTAQKGTLESARPIRIYLWYPAQTKKTGSLTIQSFLKMAADDFGSLPKETVNQLKESSIPVQLKKGLNKESLEELMKKHTASILNAPHNSGSFPLIVMGQGLYYESPFTHLVLCEFLASHGYIVATSPLFGTHYRLVNLNVIDLETQIRDMEFVISQVCNLPCVHPAQLGIIGFDMGGMAGIILAMRNPSVDAFISLDSGILFKHSSGLPQNHSNYDEDLFRIPWMHITQARFVPTSLNISSTMDRKKYGDSYLILANTVNHSDFTSYAMFGIERTVPGYWGPVLKSPKSPF